MSANTPSESADAAEDQIRGVRVQSFCRMFHVKLLYFCKLQELFLFLGCLKILSVLTFLLTVAAAWDVIDCCPWVAERGLTTQHHARQSADTGR